MAGSQITVAVTQVDEQRKGYIGVSLTNFASQTLEPELAAGSIVEIAGALFRFVSNETITGFAGLSNGTLAYLLLTVSGSSVTASWTATPPTWDAAKQGWYTGTNRVIGGLFKDSGGNPTNKWLYGSIAQSQQLGLKVLGNGNVELPANLVMASATPSILPTMPLLIGTFGQATTAKLSTSTQQTQNNIYDFFSPALPANNDEVVCHGAYGDVGSGNLRIFSFMRRNSGTVIVGDFLGWNGTTTFRNANFSFTDGLGTAAADEIVVVY